MAELVLEIADDQHDRVVDALCKTGGYAGRDCAKERDEFARRVVAQQVRLMVGQVEITEARAASQSEAIAPLDIR